MSTSSSCTHRLTIIGTLACVRPITAKKPSARADLDNARDEKFPLRLLSASFGIVTASYDRVRQPYVMHSLQLAGAD